MRLVGHSKEGYGLDWNPLQVGLLLSGSDDNRICMWDINQSSITSQSVDPVCKWDKHTQVVEDVAWN